MKTSRRLVKLAAAVIWYIGAIILAIKGGSLLFEAAALRPQQEWHWFVVIALGLLIGAVKTKFIFSKSIRKNLLRIDALDRPRVYLCFRPGFFLFLAAMITLGATLSRLAHGNHVFLLCVAAFDISLAVALLSSSVGFWKEKAFAKP